MATCVYMNRLLDLRDLMKDEGIDLYIITHADEHTGEYVGRSDEDIAYICGFTGENCTVVVTAEESHVWADGRFFIQAHKETGGSGTEVFEDGEEGVPTVEKYLSSKAADGMTVAYNGRKLTVELERKYRKAFSENKVTLRNDVDLISRLWKDRPKKTCESVFVLEERYSGKSTAEKLSEVKKHMDEVKADMFILSDLPDIAWLLNLRGNDIPCTPVFYSYLTVSIEHGKGKDRLITLLYANEDAFDPEIEAYLTENGIILKPYNEIYHVLKSDDQMKVLIDPSIVNTALIAGLSKAEFIEEQNYTSLLKAVKNETEVANTKKAHIIDAVAMCRFLYKIKKDVIDIEEHDEYSIGELLYKLREEGEDYIEPSFPTIAAYGENAALMHYSATKTSKAKLQKKGFLLVDSGGTYRTGTTDITRTIVLGELSEKQKRDFTLVLKSSLSLMRAKFPEGVCGQNLDVLARGIMWEHGLDYRCGTGHGVGHVLSVHEGPNGFRWKLTGDRKPYEKFCPLKPGMITTVEPGLYYEGEYGIRTENEMLCVKDEKTEYWQFLRFENITLVPIDLEGIEVSMLSETEKEQLNSYHKRVYETIAPLLSKDEACWLAEATRAI